MAGAAAGVTGPQTESLGQPSQEGPRGAGQPVGPRPGLPPAVGPWAGLRLPKPASCC